MEGSQLASPPMLPPRTKQVGLIESRQASTECIAHSPTALLTLITSQRQAGCQQHKHEFYTFCREESTITKHADNLNEKDTSLDKENHPPPREAPVQSRFHCIHCHSVLCLSTETTNSQCEATDFPTHHYHKISAIEFQCCGCQHTIEVALDEPILSNTLFQALAMNRINLAEEDIPTQQSTLEALLGYIKDVLRGVHHGIDTSHPTFTSRVGNDKPTYDLLDAIGFTLQDSSFVISETCNETRLDRICHELELKLYELADSSSKSTDILPGDDLIEKIIGTSSVERGNNDVGVDDEHIRASYCTLGLTLRATDSLVSWSYRRLLDEDPKGEPKYINALSNIAKFTQSEPLLAMVVNEQSRQKFGGDRVDDAYQYFGIVDNSDTEDSFVIGLYNLKASEEPLAMKQHHQMLCQIAEARHSKILFEFLRTHDIFPSHRRSDPAVDETSDQPRDLPLEMPVGLDNIGNTCYLNSLLQYYFTLTPFRNTIIQMEKHVENEDQPDWVSKKIGGIEVDQAEVRRAKKFVSLLRDLFINLEQATEKSIAPEHDLAYMALLSQKAGMDEEETIIKDEAIQSSSARPASELSSHTATPASSAKDTELSNTSHSEQIEQNAPEAPLSHAVTDSGNVDITTSAANNLKDTPDLPPAYQDIVGDSPPSAGDKTETLTTTSKSVPAPQPPSQPVKKPNVDLMIQQDVTECMGNMMYLVEAALRPLETRNGEQVSDMVRELFYGKARQILTYKDTTTNQSIRKPTEEEFSHVIVAATNGKDLYDGLDEYFFADQVENFRGGREATREVSVVTFPPVLQIQVQRVQYSLERHSAYKSNAFIQFDSVIYMDRYCDSHFDELADSRIQVAGWRTEMDACMEAVKQLTLNKAYPMPVPDMLETTARILEEYQGEHENKQEYEQALEFLQQEANTVRNTIEKNTQRIAELRSQIKDQYAHFKEHAYKLHAVFIHQGQASYGHYWIYIHDSTNKQWWKYNDSIVTKVDETEIYRDTTGSTANPYFLVYVKEDQLDTLVQTAASDV